MKNPTAFYVTQDGYVIESSLPIDQEKLVGVTIIHDRDEAERVFRENNGLDVDDGVYIPELIDKDGVLLGSGANTCFGEIDEHSAEEYINNYTV